MKDKRRLTEEERVLWSRVARTATPLKGKTPPEDAPAIEQKPDAPNGRFARRYQQETPSESQEPVRPPTRQPTRLDAPTRGKLTRGRIGLAGRVDLHGLSQKEAHALLLSVLRRAREDDRRYILVITGKGSAAPDGGVLRRAVPQWFSTPPFQDLVSGYDAAGRKHGGGGALYVRVRRRRKA